MNENNRLENPGQLLIGSFTARNIADAIMSMTDLGVTHKRLHCKRWEDYGDNSSRKDNRKLHRSLYAECIANQASTDAEILAAARGVRNGGLLYPNSKQRLASIPVVQAMRSLRRDARNLKRAAILAGAIGIDFISAEIHAGTQYHYVDEAHAILTSCEFVSHYGNIGISAIYFPKHC